MVDEQSIRAAEDELLLLWSAVEKDRDAVIVGVGRVRVWEWDWWDGRRSTGSVQH